MRMKVWQIGVVVAIVLAAGALTAVAIALSNDRRGESGVTMMGGGNAFGQAPGSQDGQSGQDRRDAQSGQDAQGGNGACPNSDGDQAGRGQNGEGWGGRGMMGRDGGMMGPGTGGQQGPQLTQEQRQQILDLMNEHRADMQAWSQKYGDNPQSDAAQKALQELRTEHAQEIQKLLDKLGIQGMGRGMWRDGGVAPDSSGSSSSGSGSIPSSSTPGIGY
jgi:hypothetical protein